MKVAGDRMQLLGLLLVIVVFGMAPAKAGDALPPFELPDGDMQIPIPKGQGMRFFEGKWEYVDRSGGFPVTVTDKAFINESRGGVRPYRILVEARNYILLAVLVRPDFEGQANIPWTNFEMLTLSAYGGMNNYYCRDESMRGGDHAFSWPREKLMRVFRASCLSGTVSKYGFPFGKGWSRSKYQRR